MDTVEECAICVEDLGAPHRPAAQVACGHIFCYVCVERLVKTSKGSVDCPHCRQPFKLKHVRLLAPWTNGLRLKDQSAAEEAALRGLDEVRQQRADMERRANDAERALRHALRAAESQRPTTMTTSIGNGSSSADAPHVEPAAHATLPCTSVPLQPQTTAPSLALTAEQRERIAANRAAALEQRNAPPQPQTAAPSLALTADQRERMAANRAAALERKRAREADGQRQQGQGAERAALVALTPNPNPS